MADVKAAADREGEFRRWPQTAARFGGKSYFLREHFSTSPGSIMIIHPLLKLAMTQPHLLGDHVEAYAALVGEEAKKVSSSLAVRIGLYAGAGVLALIGLVLAGVALLLRASISPVDYPAGWALLIVPLTPSPVPSSWCSWLAPGRSKRRSIR